MWNINPSETGCVPREVGYSWNIMNNFGGEQTVIWWDLYIAYTSLFILVLSHEKDFQLPHLPDVNTFCSCGILMCAVCLTEIGIEYLDARRLNYDVNAIEKMQRGRKARLKMLCLLFSQKQRFRHIRSVCLVTSMRIVCHPYRLSIDIVLHG